MIIPMSAMALGTEPTRRVRLPAGVFYSREARKIRAYPVLSYLSGHPVALAEMSEEEALELASALIKAVQLKRQHDREIATLGPSDLS